MNNTKRLMETFDRQAATYRDWMPLAVKHSAIALVVRSTERVQRIVERRSVVAS